MNLQSNETVKPGTGDRFEVRNPYSNVVVGILAESTPAEINAAVAKAVADSVGDGVIAQDTGQRLQPGLFHFHRGGGI